MNDPSTSRPSGTGHKPAGTARVGLCDPARCDRKRPGATGGRCSLSPMGKVYEQIDDRRAAWLTAQPMFVVATAPLAGDGLINASPKGGSGTFAVLGPSTVAYLDLTGSGVETIAHLRENGRIVLMFMAFEGRPQIVRLHGRGRAVLPGDAEFSELVQRFPPHAGTRSVIVVEIDRIADSCGYAVPRMDYVDDRDVLDLWAQKKGPEGIAAYWAKHNAASLDGLPGLDAAFAAERAATLADADIPAVQDEDRDWDTTAADGAD